MKKSNRLWAEPLAIMLAPVYHDTFVAIPLRGLVGREIFKALSSKNPLSKSPPLFTTPSFSSQIPQDTLR